MSGRDDDLHLDHRVEAERGGAVQRRVVDAAEDADEYGDGRAGGERRQRDRHSLALGVGRRCGVRHGSSIPPTSPVGNTEPRKPAGRPAYAVVTIDRMSDLKIALVHAGEREERAVTTGTKAWEPFKDDAERDRRPGERRAQGPVLRAPGRRRGRGRRDRQRRRPRHPAALDRARDGAGGPGPLPGRPARDRAADPRRLLLRLRRRDPVRTPRTSRRSRPGCARSSRRASGSPGGSPPTPTRSTSSRTSPTRSS